MKELILEKTRELFLTIGFKSVTMDQIASELGISKKTIYNFFENKTELINATTNYMFESITKGITEIKKTTDDPISEFYDIHLFLIKYLKEESVSPYYQLEKYYPQIHKEINKKQFDFITKSTTESLKKGIKLGLYRKDIKIEYFVSTDSNTILNLCKKNKLFNGYLRPKYLAGDKSNIVDGIIHAYEWIKKNKQKLFKT